MIVTVYARDLQQGDVLSTDGYKIESARALYDGRISVTAWLDASGGIHKSEVLDPLHRVHLFVPDAEAYADRNGREIKVGDTVRLGEAEGRVLLLQSSLVGNRLPRIGVVYAEKLGFWGDCRAVDANRLEIVEEAGA